MCHDSPKTPSDYSVRAVPTLVFFNGGEAVETLVGLKSEKDLRARIEGVIEKSSTGA